jgi:hypothetical protein
MEVDLSAVVNDFGNHGARWVWAVLCSTAQKNGDVIALIDRFITRGWNPSIKCACEEEKRHHLTFIIF